MSIFIRHCQTVFFIVNCYCSKYKTISISPIFRKPIKLLILVSIGMDQNTDDSFENLRHIILNAKEPLIIKNQIQSSLTIWSLSKWKEVLENELLHFRCGKNQHTQDPQWESTCLTKMAKFEDFLSNSQLNEEEWWYFDYKYLCEWFTDKEDLKDKIIWSALGFPEITSNESTIWIGSKGAHTPCHIDTYGCNMVFQVFGRKQWLLFPPEQNLRPTRIPFEESSIYSKLNFFSPIVEKFKGISNCRKLILNPGDVLVVPHRWWHYVENLETAISINAWLPLPQDEFQRIKESIATIFVDQIVKNQAEYSNVILNPNMSEEMVSADSALKIINTLAAKCKSKSKIRINAKENVLKVINDESDIEQLLAKFKNICKIPILGESEFKEFLLNQSQRFCKSDLTLLKESEDCRQYIDFLEAITDEDVLELIANKLIEKK